MVEPNTVPWQNAAALDIPARPGLIIRSGVHVISARRAQPDRNAGPVHAVRVCMVLVRMRVRMSVGMPLMGMFFVVYSWHLRVSETAAIQTTRTIRAALTNISACWLGSRRRCDYAPQRSREHDYKCDQRSQRRNANLVHNFDLLICGVPPSPPQTGGAGYPVQC